MICVISIRSPPFSPAFRILNFLPEDVRGGMDSVFRPMAVSTSTRPPKTASERDKYSGFSSVGKPEETLSAVSS